MPKYHTMTVNVGSGRQLHLFSLGLRQGLSFAFKIYFSPRVSSLQYAKVTSLCEKHSGFGDMQKPPECIGYEFNPQYSRCGFTELKF